MRLIVGSIMHETNTFSTIKTNLKSFQETELLLGSEILECHSGRETEIGGILNVKLFLD